MLSTVGTVNWWWCRDLDVTSLVIVENAMKIIVRKGSDTSGNYGHAGRPGHRGGSMPKNGSKHALTNVSSVMDFAKTHSPYDSHRIAQIEFDSPSQRLTDTGSVAGFSGNTIYVSPEVTRQINRLIKFGILDEESASGIGTLVHEYMHVQSPHIGVLSKPGENQIEEGIAEYFAREATNDLLEGAGDKRNSYKNNVRGLEHLFTRDEIVKLAKKNDAQRRLTVIKAIRDKVREDVMTVSGNKLLADAVAKDLKDPIQMYIRPYTDFVNMKNAHTTFSLLRALHVAVGLKTIDFRHYRQ